MAKIEKIVHGDFDTILDTIHRAVLKKSSTSSCEEGSEEAFLETISNAIDNM